MSSINAFRVVEQTIQPKKWYNLSPLDRKQFRIEFKDDLRTYWQIHQGAGEFDTIDQAVAWVNGEVNKVEPEEKVVYERTIK